MGCKACFHDHAENFKILFSISRSSFGRLSINHECVKLFHFQSVGILVRLSGSRFPKGSIGKSLTDVHVRGKPFDIRRVERHSDGLITPKDLNTGIETWNFVNSGLVCNGEGRVLEDCTTYDELLVMMIREVKSTGSINKTGVNTSRMVGLVSHTVKHRE